MSFTDQNHKARREAIPDNLKLIKKIKQQAHCREDFISLCKKSKLESFNNVYSELFELLKIIESKTNALEAIQTVAFRELDKERML